MPPAPDTPSPDSTVSHHPSPSPGRQKLTEALLACLDKNEPPRSFLDCLQSHEADVSEWIEQDLRAHFVERWKRTDEQHWPHLHRYTQTLLAGHEEAVKDVYRDCRKGLEAACTVLERFSDIQPLGQGGFGEVVKATDTTLQRTVAIKLSHWHEGLKSPADLAEPRAAAQLQGPGFVTIHDVLLTRTRRLAIVMEWVSSPTLAEALTNAARPFEVRRACKIMVSLLEALAKIHQAGLAHNDLKPANLFLKDDDTVLVSDFGGTTLLGQPVRQLTNRYAAPELIAGANSAVETDVYSAACVAYELLTGRACHAENKRHDGRYKNPRELRPDLPHGLAEALKQALSLDPMQRPRSAAEFAAHFRHYLAATQPATDLRPRLDPAPVIFGRDAESAGTSELNVEEEARAAADFTAPGRSRLYYGEGGIGKSTFALAVAHHPAVAMAFGAHRYQVTLDGVRSASAVVDKVADALGLVGPDRSRNLEELLQDRTARLLLLDTVDEPLDGEFNPVNQLLNRWGQVEHLTLLLTARPDCAPTGRWLMKKEVRPLSRPALKEVFLNNGGDRHASDRQLDPVLALADGLPLAAELLGNAVLDYDNLTAFLDAWKRSRVALLPTTGQNRRASLRRTVEFSLNHSRLCDNVNARRVLRLLAELPDGLFRDDLDQLFADWATQALADLRHVGGLVRIGDRLTMLAPIREELHQLIPGNDDDWQRAVDYFAEWVAKKGYAFRFEGDAPPLARFRDTQQNLELLLHEGLQFKIAATVRGIQGLADFGYRIGIDYQQLLSKAAELAKDLKDDFNAAFCQEKIGDVLQQRGRTDEALRIYHEECLPVYKRLGKEREEAVTMGRIADVYQQRGQLDEALRIRREKCLPVFERLGDALAMAISKEKNADVLLLRGQIDKALRIYREECLPVFQRPDAALPRAICWGKVANVLGHRGQLDEALHILQEECLPIYERLGDVYGKAVTMGGIADVMQQQGQLDEALRIRHEKCLPVFERLGDAREQIICRAMIGRNLIRRGYAGDHPEARVHLGWALAEARRLQLPESTVIEEILDELGKE